MVHHHLIKNLYHIYLYKFLISYDPIHIDFLLIFLYLLLNNFYLIHKKLIETQYGWDHKKLKIYKDKYDINF